jgi:hypothetical protein
MTAKKLCIKIKFLVNDKLKHIQTNSLYRFRLSMQRARTSRDQNTRLTLVYVRHALDPGTTEPGIPGLYPGSMQL